jgi:hypothetical protein
MVEPMAAKTITRLEEDAPAHEILEGLRLLDGEDDLPQDWNSAELNISYIDNPASMAECVAALRHPDVSVVALDIETTGGLKPWYGSTRLIQLGVELPEPRQFLIDCWAIDPAPVFPVLEDPQVEILTCNGRYEQSWLHYRYGVVLTNLWDVSYASKVITKAKQDVTRARAKEQIKRAEAPYKERLRMLRKDQRAAVKAENTVEVARLDAEIKQAETEQAQAALDIKQAVVKPRKISNDFRRLMRRYVGKQISKTQQTSAWDDPELSDGQRRYAAMDVAGLLDIRRGLGRDVTERGLDSLVDEANRQVLELSLKELRNGDTCGHQFGQLARTMLHCRDVETLDRMFAMQGKMTLHYSFRAKVTEIYQQRRAQLTS